MEISQMRKHKSYLFRAPVAKELAAITCVLTETHKQAEEWERFIKGKRGEAFKYALIGGYWWESCR